MVNTARSLSPDADLAELRRRLSRFEELLTQFNVKSHSSTLRVWEAFSERPPEVRASILDSLQQSIDLASYVLSIQGGQLTSKQIAWYGMSRLGLRCPSNLFDLIEESDHVEVYNSAGIQIFRDFGFFSLVSYSIAEIAIYRWDELFERKVGITEEIIEQGFQKGFSGIREPYRLSIEEHCVKERFSEGQRSCAIRFKYLSPLFNADREITAIMATSTSRSVKEGAA